MAKTFSVADVAQVTAAGTSMYIIIDGGVYDITSFIAEHPGGAKILRRAAGKDASAQFWKYHSDNVLPKYGAKLKIGVVEEKPKL